MDDMSMAWLTFPLQLDGSREFECGDFTAEQCDFYTQRWHFWYIADYVFALPTVAFFMCTIAIFVLANFLSSHILAYRRFRGPPLWQKTIAIVRYLGYRGFHVKALGWNSAPAGVLLLGLAGLVFFFCMDLAPQPYYWADSVFGGSPPLATRSGWMALACMPFVFATASKTNWITLLTGVSHERLQVFHRWIAYAFFVLALLHTFPFIVYHIHWHDMESHFTSSLLFYWTGIVAIVAQAWLTFASHSSIRKLGYEFFKMTHFIAVVIFIVTFFWHCDYTLTSWDYFVATAAVYVPCYVYPWLRTLFEHGVAHRASISIEDNGFTRITIPANTHWTPGQHCFLRFTSFGILQALSTHPFTICSSPSIKSGEKSEMLFYLRHQGGFTAKLYEYAKANPDATVPVLIDGPYGGVNLQRYRDSDHLLVIAGGSGAGWCLPFIERFLRSSSMSTARVRDQEAIADAKEHVPVEEAPGQRHTSPISLRVILATRDASSRIWFLRTVGELLSKYSETASSGIRVQVHVTGSAAKDADLSAKLPLEHVSASPSISSNDRIEVQGTTHDASIPGKEVDGRPRLSAIVHDEAGLSAEAGESLGVFICGPDTMQNDVRNAVAAENLNILKGGRSSGVYLHSEHFSWA
ncbi:hypothetical protein P280DRAFT_517583 [Massarina eburnea CBS 473.64]|uniref:ferric-chelate reductase (NADPH) n=1 Tax=Massarina eburnea CBS 473.64 TaxID=1395130 RepID=A0A6A6S0K9_9PLEO|nr:hypothetical protein P280DRAFT_517583 [Massarina eburnea CBS 473.64]